MENYIATASAHIKAHADKIWAALVTPDAIKQYMFGTTVVTDWKEGSKIAWKGEWHGKPYEDKGTILRVQQGKILEYTHFSPLAGAPDKPENYHKVTIELQQRADDVIVTLHQDNNNNTQEQEQSQKNWAAMLDALKKYVEEGTK